MVGMIFLIPVYADHSEVTIETAAGSGAPGCDATEEGCYIPSTAVVDVGGVVIMSNTDTAAHTFTAGTPAEGVSGQFDTGLLMAGNTFEYFPETVEEINYYCMVHPWMEGLIIVQSVEAEKEEHEEAETGEHEEELTTLIKGMSEDGSVNIYIKTTNPTTDEEMTIVIEFSDASGKEQKHMNYEIIVTQNGKEVLSDNNVHLMEANAKHVTNSLISDDPVDITITLQGIGMNEPYTGPKGEIVKFNVIPEFGTIAMVILGISITSIVVLGTKSKIIPRF